jgi:hypothetical protein
VKNPHLFFLLNRKGRPKKLRASLASSKIRLNKSLLMLKLNKPSRRLRLFQRTSFKVVPQA